MKISPFHELEQSLVKWIHVVRERKIALNGQHKSLEFAEALGVTDFHASGGWLDRTRLKRENLNFKAITF